MVQLAKLEKWLPRTKAKIVSSVRSGRIGKMSRRSAIDFWARLADDEAFRHRFMAVDASKMQEFLRQEGFDFAVDELAAVVNLCSKFGTAPGQSLRQDPSIPLMRRDDLAE